MCTKGLIRRRTAQKKGTDWEQARGVRHAGSRPLAPFRFDTVRGRGRWQQTAIRGILPTGVVTLRQRSISALTAIWILRLSIPAAKKLAPTPTSSNGWVASRVIG